MIVNSSPYCRVWRRIDGHKRKIVGKFGKDFPTISVIRLHTTRIMSVLAVQNLLLEESYVTFTCEHIKDTRIVVTSEAVNTPVEQRWQYVVSLFQHGWFFYSYCLYKRKTVEKSDFTFQRSHYISYRSQQHLCRHHSLTKWFSPESLRVRVTLRNACRIDIASPSIAFWTLEQYRQWYVHSLLLHYILLKTAAKLHTFSQTAKYSLIFLSFVVGMQIKSIFPKPTFNHVLSSIIATFSQNSHFNRIFIFFSLFPVV